MYELIGHSTETGKRKVVHSLPDPGIPFKEILRSCGQCAGCRYRRRMDWAIRLEHEAKLHPDAIFLTLTYDDENLPHGGSLFHDHISKFVRALRKKLKRDAKAKTSEARPGCPKIRYFGVGEYGGELGRPHYHLILFGWFPPDARLAYVKRNFSRYSPEFQAMFGREGIKHYSSEIIDSVWAKGIAHFSTVSAATMQYVTKFHIDKVTGDKAVDFYQSAIGDQVYSLEPEQARMSLKPGLGTGWIEKYWRDVYPRGHLITKNGVPFAPPKFYDRWLEKYKPEVFESVKAKRDERISFDGFIDRRLDAIDVNRTSQMSLGVALGKGQYHGSTFGVTAADLAASAAGRWR